MKLYTRTGDDGTTGLIGGSRVPKHDPRVAAYGEVDEANAAIGLVICACADAGLIQRLRAIQSDLFILGAELATRDGGKPEHVIRPEQIKALEDWIDGASDRVPSLRNFILPGGCEAAARLHLARAVSRRAERAVTALASVQNVAPSAAIYLNRLSDLLFALARQVNHDAGVPDIPWSPPVVGA
jgi:cob(I)alamin adenosyltransferase